MQPNILVILTDQHAKRSLGAYGSAICRTPVLDQLAAESVVFDNAYTSCPVCSPAHTILQLRQAGLLQAQEPAGPPAQD